MLSLGFLAKPLLAKAWQRREIRGATVGSCVELNENAILAPGSLASRARAIAELRVEETPEWFPMSHVPSAVLSEGHWLRLMAGRWRFREHINLGEARSGILWPELLFKAGVMGVQTLSLTDSRVSLGMFGKGRSPAWRLNRVARGRARSEAVTANTMAWAWTPTYFQPSGEGTRVDDILNLPPGGANYGLEWLASATHVFFDFARALKIASVESRKRNLKITVVQPAWNVRRQATRLRVGAGVHEGNVVGFSIYATAFEDADRVAWRSLILGSKS